MELFKFFKNNSSSIEDQIIWLQSILLSIHDGVLVIDRNSIVKMINPEYTKITGVKARDIIGRPLKEVRPNAQLVEIIKDGKERVGIYRKEGDIEYVVDMAPIRINEQVIGAVSVCKGLTEVHKLAKQLQKDRDRLQLQIGSIHNAKYTFDQIIGKSRGLSNTVRIAKRIAKSDLSLLILGESGTGKELFAQSIHNESKRALNPFIPINCATIPPSLIESELFGYEEGSFTDSKSGGKVGLFEMANGGTIFLDEIGELSLDLQAKFLRVLEEQTIRKIGSTTEKKINVRVIAATNRDLGHLIQKKMFREDLYYRLNVLKLNIPPLRNRIEDIPLIVKYVLQKQNEDYKETQYNLSKEALDLLQKYKWPGNVRELINTIKFSVCMTESKEITVHDLPENMINNHLIKETSSTITLKEIINKTERQHLVKSLKRYGNSLEAKQEIARELGISVATLYNKLNKHDIQF